METGGRRARSEPCTTGPDPAISRPNQPPIESWKWLNDYLPGSSPDLSVSLLMDNLIVLLLVGLVAGFLATKVMTGAGMGLIWDIVVGVLGAFLAGWLPRLLGLPVVALPAAASVASI